MQCSVCGIHDELFYKDVEDVDGDRFDDDEPDYRFYPGNMRTLPCIVCGTRLQSVSGSSSINHPSHGVACSTHGNYGSTVWDSLNGDFLEFNICDDCLKRARECRQVAFRRGHQFHVWGEESHDKR